MDTALVTVAPETSCGDALRGLVAARASVIIVVDGDGRAIGIVTEQDVSRRLVFQQPSETPIEAIMTRPVRTIGEDELLFNGIARMRRAELRHMPVVNSDGAVSGILQLDRALAAASGSMLALIDRLTHEDSFEGLSEVKAAEVELAARLFADQVPAPEIQSLLTLINNDLYRRADRLCRESMLDDGMGPPPVAYCFLVMGSGGRGESYLNPDQDNGLILADYPDHRHDEVDRWFRRYADRLTRAMDEIGMPLCRGYVMAVNPLWRKTESQWRAQMGYWLRHANEATLRLADIFFDFRPVFGEFAFAERLRVHITDRLAESPSFLRAMVGIDAEYGVALGLFNRFIVDHDAGPTRGMMNLKLGGSLPLVNALRLLALRHRVAETSCLERIQALGRVNILDSDEADYLEGAFGHITLLMLERQIDQFRATGGTNNFVDPESLSERERDILVDAMKAIRRLSDRVRSELTGELF